MTSQTTRGLIQQAQQSGYRVVSAEQSRSNRWVLQLVDDAGQNTILLVQVRPLIAATDVQDLADLVLLRRADHGILLAPGGAFSPAATRTLAELGGSRLHLWTTLPDAARAESPEPRTIQAPKPL